LLEGTMPGLDALRAVPAARLGVTLTASFIAGYGVLAITERRGAIVAVLTTLLFTAAGFVEVFHEPTAKLAYDATSQLDAYPAGPPTGRGRRGGCCASPRSSPSGPCSICRSGGTPGASSCR